MKCACGDNKIKRDNVEHTKNKCECNRKYKFMKLPKLKCNRCNHSWTPRKEKPPKVCPLCNSPYWDKKRKYLLQETGIIKPK